MRRRWYWAVVAALVALCLAAGCARRAPAPKTAVPMLPDWAPKSPSPQFLRAAKVLKPMPSDFIAQMANAIGAAKIARWQVTWVASWEVFGSMTDAQIEQFRATGQVKVPVKSLTKAQRAALDRYFEVWRQNMAGLPFDRDELVMLYKEGAQRDLSNVDVGFVSDGRGVNMRWWITRRGGGLSTPSNTVGTI